MITIDLTDKRVLITQSDFFMGPALVKVFKKLGAVVIEDSGFLNEVEKPDNLVEDSFFVNQLGEILVDILAEEIEETQEDFLRSGIDLDNEDS